MTLRSLSRPVTQVRPDSKGRVTLGQLARGVSSFRLEVDEKGRILLEPFVEIPAKERWLFDNPEALGRVKRGLADSAAGRTSSLGSFAKHAEPKKSRSRR